MVVEVVRLELSMLKHSMFQLFVEESIIDPKLVTPTDHCAKVSR